jgi:hypothetical protein
VVVALVQSGRSSFCRGIEGVVSIVACVRPIWFRRQVPVGAIGCRV